MITMKVQAKGTSRVVNWSRFKQGELVDQSRWSFSLGTVIPDVIADVITICQGLTKEMEIKTLFPNGFSTASFDIAIRANGFDVNCGRRLIRGGFPLNPLAPEYGANFDVLLAVSSEDPTIEEQIASAVREKYTCQTE
jgi:hypothetical protein